jgi:putative hemolysin
MQSHEVVYIIIIAVLVILSAYFAAAEIAFMSLQRYKLEALVQKNVKGAQLVAWLKEHPERLLSTVLLGNNMVNIAAASISTALFVSVLGNEGQAILISTLVMTSIILIFGEAIPKTSAAMHSERVSLTVASSIKIVSVIFTPFVLLLSWISTGFGKLFGGKPVGHSLIGEEEIRFMITAGQRDGNVGEAEAEMLHKVFEFGDRPAREIMVPRTEVVWVEKGTRMSEFFTLYQKHPLNRYPVFNDRRDNVIGVLSAKEVLMTLAKGKGTCELERTIDDLVRPAYFAPESKRIGEILSEMRAKNYHLCIVIDEYGGTAGIVTLTQIVEEIVGDVNDELAEVDKDFEIIDDTTYQINGTMKIDDVNRETGLTLPVGDYETVAGLIFKILGHIPKTGEQLRYRDMKLVVTRMNENRIEEILVTKDKHAATSDQV